MKRFLILLVVTLISSRVATGSWWRENRRWASQAAASALGSINRDVGDDSFDNLAKSLGFESDSEEFLDLFKIADKDGNGELDEFELKHLKQLAQGMKKLKKISGGDS